VTAEPRPLTPPLMSRHSNPAGGGGLVVVEGVAEGVAVGAAVGVGAGVGVAVRAGVGCEVTLELGLGVPPPTGGEEPQAPSTTGANTAVASRQLIPLTCPS
jgi:hypothetical protein